jgi:Integrase core domain
MDGKGAWRDNVFVKRLWRSVKYEEVYLRAYDSVRAARTSPSHCVVFYNSRRPHFEPREHDTRSSLLLSTILHLRLAA